MSRKKSPAVSDPKPTKSDPMLHPRYGDLSNEVLSITLDVDGVLFQVCNGTVDIWLDGDTRKPHDISLPVELLERIVRLSKTERVGGGRWVAGEDLVVDYQPLGKSLETAEGKLMDSVGLRRSAH